MPTPCAPSSRRRIMLGLAALPLAGGAALAAGSATAAPTRPPTDLTTACIEQVERARLRDGASLTDDELDAELDRYDAVFLRAITEPSAGLGDLAGKARLMLDDLDRFHPEDRYPTDDYRLMRVILREAIAMGGQA